MKLLSSLVLSCLVLFCASCATQRTQDIARFNVELNAPVANSVRCSPSEPDSVVSFYAASEPILVPETSVSKAICRILAVSLCEEKRMLPTIIELPASLVKQVSDLSTPLAPPKKIKPLEREAYRNFAPCCRDRIGVGFFDKLELRLTSGYRGVQDSIVYPAVAGSTVYRSSVLGFDRGGSSLTVGFEMAGLWSLPTLDPSGRLQAGVLAGVMPADGSIFIPLGGEARYTFRQHPIEEFDPLLRDFFNCNSVYLFAQAGVPIDWQTGAPYWGASWQQQRYFWGAGIGYDIALACGLDMSLDLGIRQMNLPLPAIDCCSNISNDVRYPFRTSSALLLRIGLTF